MINAKKSVEISFLPFCIFEKIYVVSANKSEVVYVLRKSLHKKLFLVKYDVSKIRGISGTYK